MRRYLVENGQKLQILSILIFFVLVTGIVTGSIFYMKTGDGRAAVNEHFMDIFRKSSETVNKLAAARNYFLGAAAQCLIIFVSAYFKFGAALTLAVVLRKGFVTGFTSAAAAGAYGIKGALVIGAAGTELVAGIAALVFFSAVSVAYSIEKEKTSKKFLIFFAVFFISIFCALSAAHGFLSTTFMKLLYPFFV